jgi:hypothetical protein
MSPIGDTFRDRLRKFPSLQRQLSNFSAISWREQVNFLLNAACLANHYTTDAVE